MSDSGEAIVAVAAGELGRDDADCPCSGCYFGAGTEWCSEFVSWSYQRAEFAFTGGDEGAGCCGTRRGYGPGSPKTPPIWSVRLRTGVLSGRRPGTTSIGRAGDPGRQHSGIVESVDANGDLHTVEGNNAGRLVGRYVYPVFRMNATDNRPAETNGVVVGFGLRCGMQIRLPNGVARASSSGDDRGPDHAFDGDPATFRRNRTQQSEAQYLEMDFAGAAYTLTKVSLTFGR